MDYYSQYYTLWICPDCLKFTPTDNFQEQYVCLGCGFAHNCRLLLCDLLILNRRIMSIITSPTERSVTYTIVMPRDGHIYVPSRKGLWKVPKGQRIDISGSEISLPRKYPA